jgi:eukaryotic-like serine/threonine-protein kinase
MAILTLALVGWVATRPKAGPADTRVRAVIRTEPAGSTVSYFPLHDQSGEPQPDKVVRGKGGEVVKLQPGNYLVVAVSDDDPGRFHEVFRVLPGSRADILDGLPRPHPHESWQLKDGVYLLPPINLPSAGAAKGMCLFPAAPDFATSAASERRSVPQFYLDTTEVTNDRFVRWLDRKTSRPGRVKNPDHPARNMTWGHAAAYAEWVGQRLPDEWEFEYAATDRGRSRFPWGNSEEPFKDQRWGFGPVRNLNIDCLRIPGQPPVYGLFSNVAEWTSSWPGESPSGALTLASAYMRVVRGGPSSVISGNAELRGVPVGPRERAIVLPGIGHLAGEPSPGLGFRCARSARPRLEAKDFGAVVGR